MANGVAEQDNSSENLASFILANDWSVSLQISSIVVLIIVGAILAIGILLFLKRGFWLRNFEIDSAELGIGNQKISLKPNRLDQQIAYSIWVELSTRKVGLPIDVQHDVISEVYDSWYSFFGVTRELIKEIPVSKAREQSTNQIINLSIDVLNKGLRPHLTRWQARYRHWQEQAVISKTNIEPQALQKQFPEYQDLIEDLLSVNKKLIAYRTQLEQIVNY
ncbi:hypothetical protein [Pseudovibrio ascidiaceicola]|uniref:hypothetical protein n=1 Tax=Pseudovibrio ascidiaceicola TaxID=285279 RepID=UPI000D6948A9|nr:hypothetical protein [Pseudovibrio ascidiaceicola]